MIMYDLFIFLIQLPQSVLQSISKYLGAVWGLLSWTILFLNFISSLFHLFIWRVLAYTCYSQMSFSPLCYSSVDLKCLKQPSYGFICLAECCILLYVITKNVIIPWLPNFTLGIICKGNNCMFFPVIGLKYQRKFNRNGHNLYIRSPFKI